MPGLHSNEGLDHPASQTENFVVFCVCSISPERPEARQHRAPPWHHPHQGNPDSGLWICGECALCQAPVTTRPRQGGLMLLEIVQNRKKQFYRKQVSDVGVFPLMDWPQCVLADRVSGFNTLPLWDIFDPLCLQGTWRMSKLPELFLFAWCQNVTDRLVSTTGRQVAILIDGYCNSTAPSDTKTCLLYLWSDETDCGLHMVTTDTWDIECYLRHYWIWSDHFDDKTRYSKIR